MGTGSYISNAIFDDANDNAKFKYTLPVTRIPHRIYSIAESYDDSPGIPIYAASGEEVTVVLITNEISTNFDPFLTIYSRKLTDSIFSSSTIYTLVGSDDNSFSSRNSIFKFIARAGTIYDAVITSAATLPFAPALFTIEISTDGAGNTLNGARNFGLLDSPKNYSDFVGYGDKEDFYQFSLDRRASVKVSLQNNFGDADVQILNSSGNPIRISNNAGNASELM
jgi:hypothetical protein